MQELSKPVYFLLGTRALLASLFRRKPRRREGVAQGVLLGGAWPGPCAAVRQSWRQVVGWRPSTAPWLVPSPRGCCLQLGDFVYPLCGTLSVSFGTSATPSVSTAPRTVEKHSQDGLAFLILCLQFPHLGPALCRQGVAKATASDFPSPGDV